MLIQFIIASVLILFVTNFCVASRIDNNEKCQNIILEKNIRAKRSSSYYKLNSFIDRSCNCMTEISCSCCESVIILYTQTTKRLCVNFMYQKKDLNVNISLDAISLKSTTVTNYGPFTMCVTIPGSLFSIVCLNVLELNNFPRSLTVCPQLDIRTRGQNWKLIYRCISISTTLPNINSEKISSQWPIIYSNPSSIKRYAEKIFVTSTVLRQNQTKSQPISLITEISIQNIKLNSSEMPMSTISNNELYLNITTPL